MKSLTRDTLTTYRNAEGGTVEDRDETPADAVEGEWADVLPFGDPAAAFLPDDVDLPGPTIDPTRVRLTGLRPAEWPTEAACAGRVHPDDDPWHPGGDGLRGEFSPRARLVCIGCPVRLQCLALGLAMLPLGGAWGMYAGYTPDELRAIARRRGMADRVVAQHGTRARRVAGCDCRDCRRAHAEYVADLRAQERYAETTVAPVALPEAVPTVVRLADLFTLTEGAEDA